ncbi:HAD family hydrolase [Rubrimonas cliftonensis]|uniref:Hydroxymethylpyrimidine pyrophosphatase n=1 Tax=Rubrimonas cliftonensis TaxID=89524 RepID=A0A1H3YKM5_9RHOB|nr:HAD family hydrolase [Rubrimonas cliftonensis]SEA11781.1 Hydroxymethylpyrimidine pyrophosphatase [Rubrimonas cliftonensis]
MSGARHGWECALATDLDGTFLGGTDDHRRALYDAIEARRGRLGLIFVTGRDPEFIEELCGDGFVPWPEYVVGDVGTTIAQVVDRRVRPIAELETEIAGAWGDAGAVVREKLDGAAGLKLQPTPFRHRVSYDFFPDAYDGAAQRIVEGLGHDWLISADRYFDVLPKGVSKGPSLVRLADWLNLPRDRVLAAGDTLNDLSMLAIGVPAVAVGGSEPALLERLNGLDHVHFAEGVGAAGVAEALARLRFADFPATAAANHDQGGDAHAV